MPISSGDIKIFKSDTMADTIDGGGEKTLHEVISGESNSMFDDVSSLDRVFGAVHLRKIFPHVVTQDDNTYLSAHSILTKLPKDKKLGVNLFSTGDHHDRRPDAKSRIEGYRAKGGLYSGFLYATQWQGSKVVTIFQSTTAPLPQISDVLYLTQNSDTEFQFVKVSDISDSIQTFTINDETFDKRVVVLTISQALEFDFVGSPISKDDNLTPSATVLTTVVADAAKYYSARELASSVNQGALSVFADSIYAQVVPSSLQESAEVGTLAAKVASGLVDASAGQITLADTLQITPSATRYLGSACVPASLVMVAGSATITDSGGDLVSGSVVIGAIDYRTGVMVFRADAPATVVTVSFTPAVVAIAKATTAITTIGAGNRGNLYTQTLFPVPQRGAVSVSFRSFGEWYDLVDNGAGALIAVANGIGVGTIDYATGSVILTLSALPDVGSGIIWRWGKMANYESKVTDPNIAPSFKASLGQYLDVATLVLNWTDGGAKTAVCNAQGVLSGDAIGTVDASSGDVILTPTQLPPLGTVVSFGFQGRLRAVYNNPSMSVDGSGHYVFNIGATNAVAGSIYVDWYVDIVQALTPFGANSISGFATQLKVRARDDGSGNLIRNGTNVGTINYATGEVDLTPVVVQVSVPAVTRDYRQWESEPGTATTDGSAYTIMTIGHITTSASPTSGTARPVVAVYKTVGVDGTATGTFTTDEIVIPLTGDSGEAVADDSVRFTLGSREYVAKGNTVIHSLDANTGLGTLAGTLNKITGECVVTDWQGSSDFTIQSVATSIVIASVSEVVLRVANAPVRVSSFQIRATDIDGNSLTGDADANGNIVGTNILGTITYDNGVVKCRFGELVAATGNESESWYDAAQVEGGQIFKPIFVDPDSIVYDAVSQTFIPLDATILGLNPVRLPEDGRVPVFNKGDVVVILNTEEVTGTYVNAATLDLGRTRIAKLTIVDSNALAISDLAYSADLDTGIITWGDLSGINQPLTIEHRIEDSRVLTDVQITGELGLSQPLSHDFPVTGTLISSAVLHGDLSAHVNTPYDQQTWTGLWSDALIGNETLASFNDALHPIVVDNASTIAERWLLLFTNSTTVNVVGENTGQILTSADITSTIAPINPATGFAYFSIPPAAWGGGWSSGNALRFNTIAAHIPLWIVQSVGQGDATNTDPDALTFCIEFRGDIDAPAV